MSLFSIHNGREEPSSFDGHCPQCKTQLMWIRKKFNMGVRVFFDTCPKCLPDTLVTCSQNEAILQVECLQRNLEALTSTALNMSRDIRRIQTELVFIVIDIEERGPTHGGFSTCNYANLVNELAKSLEEKAGLIIDSGLVEPPSLLEQVKELRAEMLGQLKRQRYDGVTETASMYALVDVLKQLEQVEKDAKMSMPLPEGDRQEFQDEVERLVANLEQAKRVMLNIPTLSTMFHNVGILSNRYLRLLQDIDRKPTAENDDSEAWRKRLEELERKHAAEVEALRSQLDACMSAPVATNVFIVDSNSSAEDGKEQQEVDTPSVIEAEVVGTLSTNQRFSTVTAIAQPVTPEPTDVRPGASVGTDAHVADNVGNVESDSEHEVEETTPNSHHYSSVLSEPDPDTASRVTTESDASVSSEANALESLCSTENVSTVLSIMKEQPSKAVVQATALEKLGILTSEKNDGGIELSLYKVEENRRKVGTVFGVDLILSALRLFRKDRSAQIHGLLTISNVTRIEHGKTLVGNSGGITTVLQGMRQFPKHLQLNKNGLSALENLALNSSRNQSWISENGGIDVLLSTMNKFSGNVVIQEKACLTISCLAKSSKLRKELKRKGAIAAVKKARTVTDRSAVDALHELRKGAIWSIASK